MLPKDPNFRTRLAPYICAAIIFALNFAVYTMQAPFVRMIELAVCREYYAAQDPSVIDPGGFVDEKFCKVDSIQKKVAWLLAIDQLLEFCCGPLSIDMLLSLGPAKTNVKTLCQISSLPFL
jgi:hypothetical protein